MARSGARDARTDILRALGTLWIVGFYHLAGYVDGECGIAGRL